MITLNILNMNHIILSNELIYMFLSLYVFDLIFFLITGKSCYGKFVMMGKVTDVFLHTVLETSSGWLSIVLLGLQRIQFIYCLILIQFFFNIYVILFYVSVHFFVVIVMDGYHSYI